MTLHRLHDGPIHLAFPPSRLGGRHAVLGLGLLICCLLMLSVADLARDLRRGCGDCALTAFAPPPTAFGAGAARRLATSARATAQAGADQGPARITFRLSQPDRVTAEDPPLPGASHTGFRIGETRDDPATWAPRLALHFGAASVNAQPLSRFHPADLPSWALDPTVALPVANDADFPGSPASGGGPLPEWRLNGLGPMRPGAASNGFVHTILSEDCLLDDLALDGRIARPADLERHFGGSAEFDRDSGAAPPDKVSRGDFAGVAVAMSREPFPGLLFSDGVLTAAVSREPGSPRAIAMLPDLTGIGTLEVFRAEASYGLSPAIIPSIQYFRTAGSASSPRFAWPVSLGQTTGVIAGVTVMPWNDPSSPVGFLNLRFDARYVAYTEIAGLPRGGTPAGALSLSLWGALRF